jgi:hypothetical protein
MRPDKFLGIDAIQDINEGADFARTLCMNDHETIVDKASELLHKTPVDGGSDRSLESFFTVNICSVCRNTLSCA